MIILIDTREQKPLEFTQDTYLEYEQVATLIAGDYSAIYKDNHQCPVIFERKSLTDLFGTMGKGYKRFKKSIERAKKHNIQLSIVIEGSLKKTLAGLEYSTLEGISIIRKLITLRIRYGVEHHFFNTRQDMTLYIQEFFTRYGLDYFQVKKARAI